MLPLDLQRRQRLQERDDATRDDINTDWAFPGRQESLSDTALAQLRAWHRELEDDPA